MPPTPVDRQPIAQLPPEEVAKICAGEVVERPLSVVKELIENALDAGATEITVELEDGGKRLIRVSDNGGGIPASELELAVLPHHTSKLRVLDDLYRIGTLGFRGEALSSIGAVSRLALSSHHAGSGARIEVGGGAISTVSRTNIQRGTEVEVRELFGNVPARLKFLRAASSETAQVSALLTTYAIAYPEVRWRLRSGGRTLLQSDGDGDLHGVMSGLLGAELAADLAPVHFEYPPSAVYGLISAPHRHWHNRTRQWYLVNRRPVANKLLYKAVDDAMREFVTYGKFPAGVFSLDLPPEEIDVNVHPAKTEVAFAQPQMVYSLLLTAVRRALGDAAAVRQRRLVQGMSSALSPVREDAACVELAASGPQLDFSADAHILDPALDPDAPAGQRAIPAYELGGRMVPPSYADAPATIDFPINPGAARSAGEMPRPAPAERDKRPSAEGPGQPPERLAVAEAAPVPTQITQVADTYLVLVTAGEVYLIDQHSAHERVLFEDLWERLSPSGGATTARQELLFETRVELAPAEAALAFELLPTLDALGFSAELDGRTLLVSAVPAMLSTRATPELLTATIADLAGGAADTHGLALDSTLGGSPPPVSLGEAATSLGGVLKQMVATMACKAAVKAGQRLPESERVQLAELICSRWSSLTCPHGRPTVVRLGEGELEKLFLRT